MLSDRDMHVVWTTKAGANVSWKDFCEIARAIEREATAPLIEQIKQLSDQADRAVSVAECLSKQIHGHARKPLCWLQQDKFGNFHVADESWHGAFPVYVDKENT